MISTIQVGTMVDTETKKIDHVVTYIESMTPPQEYLSEHADGAVNEADAKAALDIYNNAPDWPSWGYA